MPSDKDRLYIALYARSGPATMPGGEDKYIASNHGVDSTAAKAFQIPLGIYHRPQERSRHRDRKTLPCERVHANRRWSCHECLGVRGPRNISAADFRHSCEGHNWQGRRWNTTQGGFGQHPHTCRVCGIRGLELRFLGLRGPWSSCA